MEEENYKILYEKLSIQVGYILIKESEKDKEIERLKKTNEELQEHLSKYTCPARSKKYYENHREEIIEKVKEYNKKKLYDPEKTKEYNKRANEKRKLKKIEEEQKLSIDSK